MRAYAAQGLQEFTVTEESVNTDTANWRVPLNEQERA